MGPGIGVLVRLDFLPLAGHAVGDDQCRDSAVSMVRSLVALLPLVGYGWVNPRLNLGWESC
jgi:hypothetical protein